MQVAQAADVPELVAFLRGHEATSMFPLARLATVGLGGAGPHAQQAWLVRRAGQIAGMVGLSAAGMILPQWPGGLWPEVRRALAGRPVSGLVGPAVQVRGLVLALGLSGAPVRHDEDEEGFTLDLRNLEVPDAPGVLLRPGPAEVPVMTLWRAAYLADLFATPPDEAQVQAARDVAAWIAADSHRVLLRDGVPVAMSGFNARLPDVVQIGGVYVPPARRSTGCAREVVARHLAEARADGVQRAVLFSVSAAATKAYRAIGFRPGEGTAIVLFDGAQEVPAWD